MRGFSAALLGTSVAKCRAGSHISICEGDSIPGQLYARLRIGSIDVRGCTHGVIV